MRTAGTYLLFAAVAMSTCFARECNPTQTWNDLIEAKGGRAVLNTIDSLLIESKDPRKGGASTNTLFVFPNFVWSNFDMGATLLGHRTFHYYLDRGYVAEWWNIPEPSGRISQNPLPNAPYPFVDIPAILFDTKLARPANLKCQSSQSETIIEGIYFGVPYEFHLNGTEKLPSLVVIRLNIPVQIEMTNYKKNKNGIVLPSNLRSRSEVVPGAWQQLKIEINPTYNPDLPNLSPRESSRPDGWRAKR